jgi:hypothetical protein
MIIGLVFIYAERFLLLLVSFPGILALRASCFTSRLCLRCPLDGRLRLGLSVVVVIVVLLVCSSTRKRIHAALVG